MKLELGVAAELRSSATRGGFSLQAILPLAGPASVQAGDVSYLTYRIVARRCNASERTDESLLCILPEKQDPGLYSKREPECPRGKILFRRFLAAVEALLIAALLYFAWYSFAAGNLTLAVVVAGLSLVPIYFYAFVLHQGPEEIVRSRLGRPRPEIVGRADLIRAEEYIYQAYAPESIYSFVRFLTFGKSHLSRVDERMELDGRTGNVNVAISLRQVGAFTRSSEWSRLLGEGAQIDTEAPLLCPLISVRKGRLLDQFEARDQSGDLLPTLSQWEVRGLLVATLDSLFRHAEYERQSQAGEALTDPEKAQRTRLLRFQMLTVALNSVCATLTAEVDLRASRARVSEEALMRCGFSDDSTLLIRSFIASLSQDYLIVLDAPRVAGNNVTLTYSHRVTPAVVSSTLDQWLRAKHGLLPAVVDAPMTWALRPDSYHFELKAPRGQYIFDHRLEQLASDRVLSQQDFVLGGVQQYVRMHQERGHEYAHLYIRKVRYREEDGQRGEGVDAPVRDFKSVIRFKEIPPGAMSNASSLAFLTSIIVIVAALLEGVPTANVSPVISGVLCILLAASAFTAAAVGRGLSSNTVVHTSMATFYSIWTVAVSDIIALCLILLGIGAYDSLAFSVPFGGSWSRISYVWVVLALLNVALYLAIRKEKSDQRRYYLRLLSQSAVSKQDA